MISKGLRHLLLAALLAGAAEGTAMADETTATRPAWKPVAYKAQAPAKGVELGEGPFKQAFEADIKYLLQSFSDDDMLHYYRKGAGQAAPPGQMRGWEKSWPGTCAPRFLLGAGNVLKWAEQAELRRRLNAIVDALEAAHVEDGQRHCLAGGKTFAQWSTWQTQVLADGMVAAHEAGNAKALGLIRQRHDWFNRLTAAWPERKALKDPLGYCAHPPCTRVYFTSAGKAEDIAQAERQFIDRDWLGRLAAREKDAIWKSCPRWPHAALAMLFVAQLDHYRATGDRAILDGMLGAWELVREDWQHVGGGLAICEHEPYPPKCYPITWKRHTGELCCTFHWLRFNHGLHQLDPDREAYAAEIEKVVYNIGLAGIDMEGKGFHYHLLLEGRKDQGRHPWVKVPVPSKDNTCCEIYGSWFCAALREYLYSVAPDGVYVNVFEPSTVKWRQGEADLALTMKSQFPASGDVTLVVKTPGPVPLKLRVRVPAWAMGDVPMHVGGKLAATGRPGTYAVLDRTWFDGETVTFTLPMGFRVTRYVGEDAIKGHQRCALEYGPILLAFVGPLGKDIPVLVRHDPKDPARWLEAESGKPLHFTIAGHETHRVMPYWQVPHARQFTCYPVIESPDGAAAVTEP